MLTILPVLYFHSCADEPVTSGSNNFFPVSSVTIIHYPAWLSSWSIQITSDGGFFGQNSGDYSRQYFYITKYSSGFEHIWTKVYNDSSLNTDYESYAIPGGYYMTGCNTNNSNLPKFFASRLDADGTPVWARYYGSENLRTGSRGGVTNNGELLSLFFDNHDSKPRTVKMDRDGNVMWCIKHNYYFSDFVTAENNSIIGFFCLSGIIYIIRINSDGTVMWAKQYQNNGGAGLGPMYSARLRNGNIMFYGRLDHGYPETATFVIDQKGNMVRHTDYQFSYRLDVHAFAEIDSGRYMFGGNCYPVLYTSYKPFIFVTDSLGNLIWQKKYEQFSTTDVIYVQAASPGQLFALCPTSISGNYYDYAAIVLGSNGYMCNGTSDISINPLGNSYTINDYPYTVTPDSLLPGPDVNIQFNNIFPASNRICNR